MIRYILLSFALVFTLALAACQADQRGNEIENRFETTAPEDPSLTAKRLRVCIDNPDCKDQGNARFELAIIILSDLDRGACQWERDQSGVMMPVALDKPDNEQDSRAPLSLDEWAALDPEQAQSLLEESSLFKPKRHTCDFEDGSATFRDAYDLLEAARTDGHSDAANELGLLYIDDPDLFDLDYARTILDPCHAFGGGLCAFNLARIESLVSDDGCGRCLGLLRIAAARTQDKGVRFMYALAKKRLGRGDVGGRVFFGLDTDGGTQRFLEEFEGMFPRLALEADKPTGL